MERSDTGLPTAAQLREAWRVALKHECDTGPLGCTSCALRAAFALLADAERRIEELERERPAVSPPTTPPEPR